jgi:hypothetical protein
MMQQPVILGSGLLGTGTLSVKLLNGSDLLGVKSDRVDAYCELKIGTSALRSVKVKKSSNPFWNEVFTFQIADPTTESLVISVYNHHKIVKDEVLGYCVIPLNKLVRGHPTMQTFPLMNSGAGSLTIELTAKDFGIHAVGQPQAFPETYPQYQTPLTKPLTQSAPAAMGPQLGAPPRTW